MTEPAVGDPAAEQAAQGGDAKVTKGDAARAFLSGVTAARTAAAPDDCPYDKGSPLAYHWLNGYMQGRS